jgi:ribosome biogenesis protein ENP2
MVPFALQGNAEEGSATPPDETDDLVIGVNAIDINPAHQLISLGTETSSGQGTVEFWDHRARKRIGLLKLPYNKLSSSTSSAASQLPGLAELHPNDASLARAQVGVTALATRSDGLNLAVGTSTGHTLLYDLRTTRPYVIKDQGYGLPMKKLEWPSSNYTNASEGALVASADSKVVKIWSSLPEAAGRNVAAINPAASINDMHIYPDSGLICLANEQPAMTACYVPALGQAPKWCRFLDNMTEEMEDNTLGAVYEDYKFVDRKELERCAPALS